MRYLCILLALLSMGFTNDFTQSVTFVAPAVNLTSPPTLYQVNQLIEAAVFATASGAFLSASNTMAGAGVVSSNATELLIGTGAPPVSVTVTGFTRAINTNLGYGVVASNGATLYIGTGSVTCAGIFFTNVSEFSAFNIDAILTNNLGYGGYVFTVTDTVTSAKGNGNIVFPTTNSLGKLCNDGTVPIAYINQTPSNLLISATSAYSPNLYPYQPGASFTDCNSPYYVLSNQYWAMQINWIDWTGSPSVCSGPTGIGIFFFSLYGGGPTGTNANISVLTALPSTFTTLHFANGMLIYTTP